MSRSHDLTPYSLPLTPYSLPQSIPLQLRRHIPIALHSRLTTQSIRIHRDAHVLLAVVALIQVLHAFFHGAHTCSAEAIPAAGVFHRDRIVEGDLQDGLAIGSIDSFHLVAHDEGDFWHGFEE